ncbi:MAG: hypothetical protein ACKO1Y_00850 [Actinomycetota bacterium]
MTPRPDAIEPTDLTYRPLKGDGELHHISRLYDLAGWGPVAPETLGRWFLHGQLGGGVIMVIADDRRDEILGMTLWSPYRMWLHDRVGIAARGRAAVLDPRLRRSGRGTTAVDATDPLRLLSTAALPVLRERGWEFTFSLPNPVIVRRRALRTVAPLTPESNIEYGPGLVIPIEDASHIEPTLEVRRGGEIGLEYDALWEAARDGLGLECAVLRNAEGLGHVRSRSPRLEFRHPGSPELLGYACISDHTLSDVLAVDRETLGLVVQSTVAWLRAHPDEIECEELFTLPHPIVEDALRQFEPTESDWVFSLSVDSLDPATDPPFTAERFYMTAGD